MPTLSDPLELMRLHVRTLFRFDAVGHMVGTNETPPMAAPRIYLGRTREGNLWHVRRDLPEDQAARLGSLLAREPALTERGEVPVCLAAAVAILAEDQPVAGIHRGPAFVFETAPPKRGGTRRLESGCAVRFHPQLREMGWTDAPDDSRQPFIVVEVDGSVVAICHSSRSTTEAAAAGVSTAPDYRGRGFGRRVVAGWAAEVIGEGRTAFYSTTWDNEASLAIARGLGLPFIGEDWHMS